MRVKSWYEHLPSVHLHYAVKTNPDDMILREMIKLNQGFDCASSNEIKRVLELGSKPENIIFANTCK